MKTFFHFEKQKLQDYVQRDPMDYEKEFSDEERTALEGSLNYSSAAYLDSNIRFFPNYEKAKRIEMTIPLTGEAGEITGIVDSVQEILLGQYQIGVDFWFLAKSQTRGMELNYPRNVTNILLT